MDTDGKLLKKIFRIHSAKDFSTMSVATYFPEFKNHYGDSPMKIKIEETDLSSVKITEYKINGSNINMTVPYRATWMVAASNSGRSWETAFEAVFTLKFGMDLMTQANRIFFSVSNVSLIGLHSEKDNIGVMQ